MLGSGRIDMPEAASNLPTSFLTIGHSTRSIEEFIGLLRAHQVSLVIDVRKMPGSRKHPQFNSDTLAQSLHTAGIGYAHIPALGGLRRPARDSPNTGWKNASFRAYADYMLTPEFGTARDEMLKLARGQRAAIMCAEAVPWRCHRSLIADALVVRGIQVEHILSAARTQPHTLRPFAQVQGTRITYPPPESINDHEAQAKVGSAS